MSVAFQGSYTADLYNASKRYRVQFQKGVALADSECREIQDVSDSFIRQLINSNYPRGSSTNNGFKVEESGTDNTDNFTIKGGNGTVDGAGVLFVDGYILFLKSDIEYKDQNNSGAITDDDYTSCYFNNDFKYDPQSAYYHETQNNDEYVREKNLKEKVYNILLNL